MEVDCKVVLDQWLTCPEQKVLPSFLASILLFVNKTPNGIEVLLHLLDQYWNPSSGTVIFEDSITISDIRVKCIDLLAQTITPSISFLKPATVNTILQFMDGKLVEPLTVSRFIDIISVLVEHDLCTTQHCMTICNQLFSYIPGKKWNQPTRFKIFTILGHLLQKYYKDINRSSMNFIDGFISIMDGEKDPRNLLLVFDLIRFVIEKLDISRHVENIFDVVFCYFPISFTTPPNDPLAITSDQLKHSLRLCLAASPYFAYFATPLLIEKLVSSSGSAKKDTMDTIRMCAPSYGAHALLPHAQDLFGALVKEVYQSSDLAMKSIALETIHQVVATLATGISIVNIRDPVERAIEDLLHQAVENLKQPELKNARSASLILRSAASASDPACTLVVNAVLPLLYHEHKVTDMVSRQKAILGILIDILEASNSLYGSINSTTQDRDLQTPLTLYKQQLLQIFVTSLINERHYSFDHQLRYQSLLGIRLMVIMKRFLSMEEVDVTVAHLTRQALDNDKDIRNLVLSTLAIVSIQAPDSLIRHTLPYLLENLEASHQDENKFEEILIAIQTLTVEPVLVCAVTKPLLSKMSAACRRSDAIDSAYTRALAKTLYQILDQTKITPQVLHVNQTIIFPTIVTETVKASLNVVDPHNCWHLNSSLLSILALILAVIVRSSSSNDQEQMVAKAFNLFINDTSGQVVSHHLFGTCVASNDDEDRCEKDMTIFFPAILGNCWKEVRLPLSNVKLFLKNLILHSTEVTCETRRLSLVKTAAVIINKWVNNDIVTFLKQCIQTELEPLLCGQDMSNRKTTLTVFVWLTKGLVVRGHQLGFEMLDRLIEWCYTDDLGSEAATGIAVILHQDEMILNRKSHATISILYRQRIFHHCAPRLIAHQNDLYCLVALSHILVHTPTQVPASEISKLLPAMTQALRTVDHEELVLSMMEVAQSIIPFENSNDSQQLNSLLDALLALTIDHDKTKIRRNALRCLSRYAQVAQSTKKIEMLRLYVPKVIKRLGMALDDKKRLVRKEAVDCREQWYMLLLLLDNGK